MREANYLIVFVTVVCRVFCMFSDARKQDFRHFRAVRDRVEEPARSLYVRASASGRFPGRQRIARVTIP